MLLVCAKTIVKEARSFELAEEEDILSVWRLSSVKENWHPRKSGTPMQFFLGNLAPLQEKWNPHQTVGY